MTILPCRIGSSRFEVSRVEPGWCRPAATDVFLRCSSKPFRERGSRSITATVRPDVRLGIVSGRRRQGKTFLLDALADVVGVFFFTATDATEVEALEGFGAAVAAHAGGGRYAFRDWDEALERLFAVVEDGLVVIDEFPYLTKASPSLPSVLQRALDPRGYARRAGSRVLLCGSARSVMGRLLAGSAPLRGRASLELIVKPLGYRESARFWGIEDPRLAVLVHSIVGGAEPLIVFYEAIMRREWTRLERGNPEAAWRNSRATFLSQVVGPHFEEICRDWVMSVGPEVFGELPGHVAAATVSDPRDKRQIQVGVAVLAPEETGRPRRILSLGEVTWDRTMTIGHVDRLRRARELLAAKGYDTSQTILTCCSGAGFDENLQAVGIGLGHRPKEVDSPMLVDLNTVYAVV